MHIRVFSTIFFLHFRLFYCLTLPVVVFTFFYQSDLSDFHQPASFLAFVKNLMTKSKTFSCPFIIKLLFLFFKGGIVSLTLEELFCLIIVVLSFPWKNNTTWRLVEEQNGFFVPLRPHLRRLS